jgi:hypothetical protein
LRSDCTTSPYTKPGVGGKGASASIVLKPCPQSKREKDANNFAYGAYAISRQVGTVSGSYGRNQATSRVQDMLRVIGREKE